MIWTIELSEEAENFLDYLFKADKISLLQIRKKLEVFVQYPRQFGKPLKGNKQGLWRSGLEIIEFFVSFRMQNALSSF